VVAPTGDVNGDRGSIPHQARKKDGADASGRSDGKDGQGCIEKKKSPKNNNTPWERGKHKRGTAGEKGLLYSGS